jgi:hypothetical protein
MFPQYKYRGPTQRHSFGALLHELFIAAQIGKRLRPSERDARGPNLQNVLAFEVASVQSRHFQVSQRLRRHRCQFDPVFAGTEAYQHSVL